MSGQTRNRRRIKYGSNVIVSILLMLGILTFIAILSQRYTWRHDMTESGLFTLSEASLKIVNSIGQPVKLKAFFATGAPEQSKAKDLFEIYRHQNRQIEFEFIDPVRNPEVAKEYGIELFGTVVLEGFGRRETLQTADEETITNALFKLTRNEQKKIAFLIGHGEGSPESTEGDGYSNVKIALEKQNYSISTINLASGQEIPADLTVLVINGPRKPLLETEINALQAFVHRGGNIMVMLDPGHDGGLGGFLQAYGFSLPDEILRDPVSRIFGASEFVPIGAQYGAHRITEKLTDFITFYPEARPIKVTEVPPEGVEPNILVSSSPQAAALKMVQDGRPNPQDGQSGKPVPIAVIAMIHKASTDDAKDEVKDGTKENPDGKKESSAHLLVVGDSDWINNTNLNLASNGDLFLNMLNYLAEEENLITVESRRKPSQPKLLTSGQQALVNWFSLGLIPLLVLAAGILVYRNRRAHR